MCQKRLKLPLPCCSLPRKNNKSQTSHERKDRILDALFTNRTETITMLNLCRGLLAVFQDYLKKFQTEAPQIHILHELMVDITHQFLTMFIKPEHIPKSVSAGKYALPLLNKARNDKSQHSWLDNLYKNLRAGYVSAAAKILQLPLRNKTIRCLSALDPYIQSHNQAQGAFKYLASLHPNVINGEQSGCFDMELNAFSVDQQFSDLGSQYGGKRVDLGFWSNVGKLRTKKNLTIKGTQY